MVEVAQSFQDLQCSPTASINVWDSALRIRLSRLQSYTNNPAVFAEKLLVEETAARRALHAIRYLVNASAPIARLPPEIMAQIFQLHNDAEPPERHLLAGGQQRINLGWIKDTHVCRRWRQIALDHPSLWADVRFERGAAWTEEAISRAKSAQFVVECSSPYNYPDRICAFMARYMHRIKVLRLGGNDASSYHTIPASIRHFLFNRAPALQTLELVDNLKLFIGSSPLTVFPGMFTDDAPQLRHLVVHGCSPDPFIWRSPLLRNLHTLDVSYLHISDGVSRSLGGVLRALEQMPLLQALTISRVFPASTSIPEVALYRIVPLPSLTQLTISNTGAGPCSAFLQHIHIPAATISIRGMDEKDGSSSIMPFLSGLVSSSRRDTVKLSLGSGGDSDTEPLIQSWSVMDGNPDVTVHWKAGRAASVVQANASVAFASPHLRELFVAEGPEDFPWSLQTWQDIAARAPGLQKVTLFGFSGNTLCGALRSESLRDVPLAFLPAIVSLDLQNMRVGPKYPAGYNHPLRVLLRAVAARAKAGHALERLCIWKPEHEEHDEELLAGFREVVSGSVDFIS